jgi:flagellar protein FliS
MPLNQYQNTQVVTSSREKILLMLYDGAINFTRMAIDRLNAGDMAGKGVYIGKAQAIIAEFINTLNHEVGGEMAARLEQLYLYIMSEYSEANISRDAAHLENALKILGTLRETWVEAVDSLKGDREQGLQRSSLVAG